MGIKETRAWKELHKEDKGLVYEMMNFTFGDKLLWLPFYIYERIKYRKVINEIKNDKEFTIIS